MTLRRSIPQVYHHTLNAFSIFTHVDDYIDIERSEWRSKLGRQQRAERYQISGQSRSSRVVGSDYYPQEILNSGVIEQDEQSEIG